MNPSAVSAADAGLAAPAADALHLWLAPERGPLAPARAAAYGELLAPAERETWQRFRFRPDRERYLLARALQRHALSLYQPARAPASWRFIAGPHGKPALDEGADAPHFNLSHTPGLVALVIGAQATLGVDVENHHIRNAPLEVADRYFTAEEARDLRGLPAGAQQARFFALWTLKESYIKALGGGLSVPLDEISFRFADASACAVGYEARSAQAEGFRFTQFELDGIAIAVAVRAAGATCLPVVVRELQPGATGVALNLAPLASF
jgi:4'-phosphopantetheinyl transferase